MSRFDLPASFDAWRTQEPGRLEPADEEGDDMGQVALLETFAVTVPGQPEGSEFKGELWATHRSGGRRIRVVAAGGEVVFDSDDHYDLGNAVNALSLWLESERAAAERKLAPTLAGECHREFLEAEAGREVAAELYGETGDGGPVG